MRQGARPERRALKARGDALTEDSDGAWLGEVPGQRACAGGTWRTPPRGKTERLSPASLRRLAVALGCGDGGRPVGRPEHGRSVGDGPRASNAPTL